MNKVDIILERCSLKDPRKRLKKPKSDLEDAITGVSMLLKKTVLERATTTSELLTVEVDADNLDALEFLTKHNRNINSFWVGKDVLPKGLKRDSFYEGRTSPPNFITDLGKSAFWEYIEMYFYGERSEIDRAFDLLGK